MKSENYWKVHFLKALNDTLKDFAKPSKTIIIFIIAIIFIGSVLGFTFDEIFIRIIFPIGGLMFLFLYIFCSNWMSISKRYYEENILLKEQQEPKLQIEFHENNSSYCHDEAHENKNPNTEHIYDSFERVWRISIYNDSPVTTIKDVKAKLTVEWANDREVTLKFTDNNVQPYWRSVDIAPGERIFIDVLEWFMQRVKEDKLRFDICHIEIDRNYTRSPQCCYYTDKGDSKIKIVVFGKDIPSQSRYFMVGAKNKDDTIDKIYMWEVKEAINS